MKKIVQKTIGVIAILSGFIITTTFAQGFGVSKQGDTSQAQAITQLLSKNNDSLITQISPQAAANKKMLVPSNFADQQKVPANKNTGANKSSTAPAQPANNSQFGDSGISKEAFISMVRNMMPLTPTQIKTLRRLYDNSQRAASAYPGTPPRPTSSSVMVNLSPGATPPIVRLRAGFVTSVDFVDATGQPWPIKAWDLGNPKGFNIQWDQKGNTLMVQAIDRYKSGNLAVMLKGEDTPIMITLMPGQGAVDYRVDLRVPGMGPNAKPALNGLPDTGSPALLTFLNGVPPNGAKTLTVSDGQSQAWEYHKHMYLRTRLTLLSPSWLSTMSSPDGTHVYELSKAPVLLASQRGKMIQLTVKGL